MGWMENGYIDLSPEFKWDGDDTITLARLAELVPSLQKKYGKNAKICFDAGHNNVSIGVEPTKKQKN